MLMKKTKGQKQLDSKISDMREAVLFRYLKSRGYEVSAEDIRAHLFLKRSDQKILAEIGQQQSWLFRVRTSRIAQIIGSFR